MGVAKARTVTLQGADGHIIDVQVDVSQGLVKTSLVGRPDTAITESRDRCRAAVTNSGFEWPATRRVTILLSPADVPKRGPHFDLAIALGVLVAAEKNLSRECLEGYVLIGELTLDGGLRAVPGVLPMTMAASRRGVSRVVVPEPQTREAAMVPGMSVYGVRSLAQALALVTGAQEMPEAPPVAPLDSGPMLSWRGDERLSDVDMSDVLGMRDARYAVEVAAAGGHHLLLSGPKGSGKTTIAERLPGLLPDLDTEDWLEFASIASLLGQLPADGSLSTRPPFRNPHHSASRASLLGGGTGRVRPGDVSRAHRGVLFLDEFALFPTDFIEALRQPLESGEVTISRGEESATFPARSMVVLATNPCPCGEYHPSERDNQCTCTEVKRREYRRKISGPIADRIDITRHVEPVRAHEAADPLARPEPTGEIRARVTVARTRQGERYSGSPWRLNADVPGPALREQWPMTEDAHQRLDALVYAGALTRRGATRVHRLAWSVADLSGGAHAGRPGVGELDVAMRLRSGDPLDLRTLEPAGR